MTRGTRRGRPTTDVLDPAWWQSDPQDAYRQLLDYPGLWRDEKSGFWLVARHADVLTIERDPVTFSSRENYRLEPSPGEETMISHDDPQHLTQRRMINKRFTPRAVGSHADHYNEMVAKLIDDAIEEHAECGRVEVVNAFAGQLPGRVTAELIGFGQERWREVKSWSERLMRIDRRMVDELVMHDLAATSQERYDVLVELLPQRLAEPADDLLSDWLAAGMDPMVIMQETGLMVAGGAETTRTVIAHGLRLLADRPDLWEQMAENPSQVPLAVEEMIRYVTPLNNMFRRATIATDVAGTAIAAGDRIALLYPAANRDPAVFDRPDDFDITRNPNPHIAFGQGTHFCLGANVARLELRLLFEQMTRRLTNLRVVTEPDIEPNIFARAVRSFEMSFDVR